MQPAKLPATYEASLTVPGSDPNAVRMERREKNPEFCCPVALCPFQITKRVAGVFVVIFTLWNLPFLFQMLQRNAPLVPAANRTCIVLMWREPFHAPLKLTGDVCQVKGCQLTQDRNLFGHADVVVFHHTELRHGASALPSAKAHPGQKWVWTSMESPSNTRALAGWNGIFNWILSFRTDSDIFVPYGELVPQPLGRVDIPEKTGLVSWVVSNYHRTQERARMYRSLSRYIKIDVFGKANGRPLCKDCLLPTISRYKFYLAFENSIHRDYITEKLWKNSLLGGAVPVVMGPPRANYEKFIPADAFIHVDDFDSAKELADFLVTMNDSSYRSFFRWRQNYGVKLYDSWPKRLCSICQRYSSLPQGKVYANLQEWFENEQSEA